MPPAPAPAQPPAKPRVQRGHRGTCDLQQDCLGESGSCSKSSSGDPPRVPPPHPGLLPTRMSLFTALKEKKQNNKNLSPKLKSTSRKILQEILFLAQLGLACSCILPLNRNCRGGHLCFLSKLRAMTTPPPAWAGSWEWPESEGWAQPGPPSLPSARWPSLGTVGMEGESPTAGRDLSTEPTWAGRKTPSGPSGVMGLGGAPRGRWV